MFKSDKINRRKFLGGASTLAVAGLASPVIAQQLPENAGETVSHNISSFRTLSWEPYFANTRKGAILVDTTSRVLHFWNEDQTLYKLSPTSVPLSEELTRRGRTSIVRKVDGPSWSPTPSMKIRNPEWPDYIGPGPENPLGTHALYLSWTYYRIHGTQDTRKIGRRSSNGCIGLYNEHIAELFALTKNGTQVLLI